MFRFFINRGENKVLKSIIFRHVGPDALNVLFPTPTYTEFLLLCQENTGNSLLLATKLYFEMHKCSVKEARYAVDLARSLLTPKNQL